MRAVLLIAALTAGAYAQAPPNLAELIAAHPKSPALAPGQAIGDEVSFQSSGMTLKGFLYKPHGAGPFPAILWNHGSEKLPGWQPELAAFYNAKGFVFFIPHRHGHGRSPGEYIVDRQNAFEKEHPNDREAVWKDQVRLLDEYNPDVVAALAWLKSQPYVDKSRIIMSGCSYGGIQTLLTVEKGLGVRGFIPFAPAAMSWANVELRKRLLRSVKEAKAPLFLLQAENDYSTGPTELLGAAIRKRGAPNQSKLYPVFGTTHQQGHAAFACWDIGTRTWGDDVMRFINAVMPGERASVR
jgi:carboxymethylenebutenolidase